MSQSLPKKIFNSVCSINHKVGFTRRYSFENRSKNSENLCIILAGYKEFTWDIIFERINEFSDEDMEVNLERVSSTLNEHEGNVWTGIISISREDAERLGYL